MDPGVPGKRPLVVSDCAITVAFVGICICSMKVGKIKSRFPLDKNRYRSYARQTRPGRAKSAVRRARRQSERLPDLAAAWRTHGYHIDRDQHSERPVECRAYWRQPRLSDPKGAGSEAEGGLGGRSAASPSATPGQHGPGAGHGRHRREHGDPRGDDAAHRVAPRDHQGTTITSPGIRGTSCARLWPWASAL